MVLSKSLLGTSLTLLLAPACLLSLLSGCGANSTSDFDLSLYSGQWSEVQAATELRLEKAESSAGEMIVTEGELTLERAVARALLNDGELAAIASNMQAQMLDADAEAAMPDPKIRLKTDNVAGSGSMSGTDNMQQELRLTQEIELGGKATARKRIGQLDAAITGSQRGVRRLDITLKTSRAFYNMLAAQQKLELAGQRVEKFTDLVKEFKSLGGLDGADTNVIARCELELAKADATLEASEIELQSARNALAASWSDMRVSFDKISGDIAQLHAPAKLDELVSRVPAVPDVHSLEAIRYMHMARRDLANSNKIPNIELLAGVRRDDDSGDHGFTVGVEVELPIWNWSNKQVRAANRRISAADASKRAFIAQLTSDLARAHGKLVSSYKLAVSLRDKMLPVAAGAVKSARDAQINGAESPWQIARAWGELFDTKADLLDAQLNYHTARLEVERLTAGKAVIESVKTDAAKTDQPQ